MRRPAAILALLLLLTACAPGSDAPPTALPSPSPAPTETSSTPPDVLTLNVIAAETQVSFMAQALGGRMQVEGRYEVLSGAVLVEEVDGQRRITARLHIDTPSVTVGMGIIDEALRLGMETGAYPVAVFDATSTTLVPITEQPVTFALAGTLDRHGQQRAVTMQVDPATLIGGRMDAHATMTINLADYGITLPEAIVSSVIVLDVTLLAASPD